MRCRVVWCVVVAATSVTSGACRGDDRARPAPAVSSEAVVAPAPRDADAAVVRDADEAPRDAGLTSAPALGDDTFARRVAALDHATSTGIADCDPLLSEIGQLYLCRAIPKARGAYREWALAAATLLDSKQPEPRKAESCRKLLVLLHQQFDGCFAERAPAAATP